MALVLLIACLFHPTVVTGTSMTPTLRPGQIVWLDRTAYWSRPPRSGEVVVFRRGATLCIKRVYRGPGETLHLVVRPEYVVWLLRESLLPVARRRWADASWGEWVESRRVPFGCVWVVGDNPLTSEDSRHYGPVPVSSIVGRVRVRRDCTRLLAVEYRPVAPHRPFDAAAESAASVGAAKPGSEEAPRGVHPG